MGRATLKTLARHLDLSVTTVSRALKDGPEVHADTIARVKEAADALGYVPHLSGIKLRTGRTFTIYSMLAAPRAEEVGDAGSVALMQGIHSVLEGTPYSLTAVPFLPGMDALAPVRRVVEAGLSDGIIFDMTRPQDDRAKYLLERGVPFVTFGRTELFTPHAHFDIDNENAAYQATALLLRKGHRRIALIDRDLDYLYTRHRLAGYFRAHAEAGVSVDTALRAHGELGAAGSREAALDMRRHPDPPTGFVCANEVATLGVLSGLREAGLVPDAGIDVVSRDGTQLTAYLNPPVSACYFSLHAAGRRLAEFLLRRIDGEPAEALQEVVKTELIERG